MKIDTELLTTRNHEFVHALGITTEKLSAQIYELRIAVLRARNLETALAKRSCFPNSSPPGYLGFRPRSVSAGHLIF
jgi:hypothetical protein